MLGDRVVKNTRRIQLPALIMKGSWRLTEPSTAMVKRMECSLVPLCFAYPSAVLTFEVKCRPTPVQIKIVNLGKNYNKPSIICTVNPYTTINIPM